MSWLHRGYEIVVTEEGDLLHLQIRDGRRRVVVQVHGSPQVAREWIEILHSSHVKFPDSLYQILNMALECE